jgi:hypothetical protein
LFAGLNLSRKFYSALNPSVDAQGRSFLCLNVESVILGVSVQVSRARRCKAKVKQQGEARRGFGIAYIHRRVRCAAGRIGAQALAPLNPSHANHQTT